MLLLARDRPNKQHRDLFGEITSDGQWNGNFDLDSPRPLPKFESSTRRGSDGSIALGHGRSRSHQENLQPSLSYANHKLHHQRSRSEMDYMPGQPPSMPNLTQSQIPALSPRGTSSTRSTLRKDSPTSRIPIRNSRRAGESPTSAPQSRASSSLSNYSGRNKLVKSPTKSKHYTNKENDKPSAATTPNRRYNPPTLSAGKNHQLSAKIVPRHPNSHHLSAHRDRDRQSALRQLRQAERAQQATAVRLPRPEASPANSGSVSHTTHKKSTQGGEFPSSEKSILQSAAQEFNWRYRRIWRRTNRRTK